MYCFCFHFPDVDECSNSGGNCQQICINVRGSYNCGCFYGYRLKSDRKSCDKGALCTLSRAHANVYVTKRYVLGGAECDLRSCVSRLSGPLPFCSLYYTSAWYHHLTHPKQQQQQQEKQQKTHQKQQQQNNNNNNYNTVRHLSFAEETWMPHLGNLATLSNIMISTQNWISDLKSYVTTNKLE